MAVLEADPLAPRRRAPRASRPTRSTRSSARRSGCTAGSARAGARPRGGPVQNLALIQSIDQAIADRPGPVTFVWVRGHRGDQFNERADELAGIAARGVRDGARERGPGGAASAPPRRRTRAGARRPLLSVRAPGRAGERSVRLAFSGQRRERAARRLVHVLGHPADGCAAPAGRDGAEREHARGRAPGASGPARGRRRRARTPTPARARAARRGRRARRRTRAPATPGRCGPSDCSQIACTRSNRSPSGLRVDGPGAQARDDLAVLRGPDELGGVERVDPHGADLVRGRVRVRHLRPVGRPALRVGTLPCPRIDARGRGA